MLNDIQELVRIRADLVTNYENNNFSISPQDMDFLAKYNIDEPFSNDNSFIFESIDLKINELTGLVIEEGVSKLELFLEDLSVNDKVEGNETKFEDIFKEQRALIFEDIRANKEQFKKLLEQEKNDLLRHKYQNPKGEVTLNKADEVSDLKIMNGSSFEVKTKLTQSLKIGNSLGINVGNRLNFNAGTYASRNLKVKEPDSPRAVNNISIRKGLTSTYKDVYSSYTKQTENMIEYSHGNVDSKTKTLLSVSNSSLDKSYSYTQTDVNINHSYTGLSLYSGAIMYTWGLDVPHYSVFTGLGGTYFDWSMIQLSLWASFTILLGFNIGFSKHGMYTSMITFTFKTRKTHELQILQEFYQRKLSRALIRKNYGIILKSMSRITQKNFVTQETRGNILVENDGSVISLDTVSLSELPPPQEAEELLTPKQLEQQNYQHINFIRATGFVAFYGFVGAMTGGLLGSLLEKFLPKLFKADAVYQESSGNANPVTGYENRLKKG